MPIVIVSVDSVNSKLEEFRELTNGVDVLFESTDPKATKLADYISSFVHVVTRVPSVMLNPANSESDEDVSIRMQAVFNTIRSLNVSSAIVVSHHNVLNAWRPYLIDTEWEIIEM
jgi:broad specificity phosphatase PhoE